MLVESDTLFVFRQPFRRDVQWCVEQQCAELASWFGAWSQDNGSAVHIRTDTAFLQIVLFLQDVDVSKSMFGLPAFAKCSCVRPCPKPS